MPGHWPPVTPFFTTSSNQGRDNTVHSMWSSGEMPPATAQLSLIEAQVPPVSDKCGGWREADRSSTGDEAFSKTLIQRVCSEIRKNLSLQSRQLTRKK